MKFQNIKSLYFNIFLFLIFKNDMYFYNEKTSFYVKTTRTVSTIPIWDDDIYLNHGKLDFVVSHEGVQDDKWRWKGNPDHWGWRLYVDWFFSRVGLDWRAAIHTSITVEEPARPAYTFPPISWLHTSYGAVPSPTPSLLFTLVISKGFCIANSFRSHQTKRLSVTTLSQF